MFSGNPTLSASDSGIVLNPNRFLNDLSISQTLEAIPFSSILSAFSVLERRFGHFVVCRLCAIEGQAWSIATGGTNWLYGRHRHVTCYGSLDTAAITGTNQDHIAQLNAISALPVPDNKQID